MHALCSGLLLAELWRDELRQLREAMAELPVGDPCLARAIVAAGTSGDAAVMDALWHEAGIAHLDMPYTAEKVWRALKDARGSQPQAADD